MPNLADIARRTDVVTEMEWICKQDKSLTLGKFSGFDGANLTIQVFRKTKIETGTW